LNQILSPGRNLRRKERLFNHRLYDEIVEVRIRKKAIVAHLRVSLRNCQKSLRRTTKIMQSGLPVFVERI
jgi:hypothetical protein